MRTYDVVIVGAGAAGLMAAGTAASQGFRTLLIEKMEKPARKVRITGKGRCNLTNEKPLDEFLTKVRVNQPFAWDFLRFFSNIRTIDFFKKNGLPLETERGDRVYPASGKAGDVANALEKYARKHGAEIECHTSAIRILTEDKQIASITIRNKKGRLETINTENVIIATGGVSYPATGSTGDGYKLANDLGHKIVEVRPSLVPLEIETASDEDLGGLFLKNVNLKLLIDDKPVAEEFGEIDFFDRGVVGGAIVLRVSREAVDALIDEQSVVLLLDLKPALSLEQLAGRIDRELAELDEKATVRDLLRKLMPMKLTLPVAKRAGLKPTDSVHSLNADNKSAIINILKNYRMTVKDYRPFEEAIVTAGGVDISQVDSATMQSEIIKGLYFAGEVLDVDANTGGYNLQLAFSSGRLAGMLKK